MTSAKTLIKRVGLQIVLLTAALFFCFTTATAQFAQQSWSPVDNGRTAAYVLPSASGTDEINLYNGRVSLRVPIGVVEGRGKATYKPTVSISRTFVMRRVQDWMQGTGQWTQPSLQLISENYQDSFDFSNIQPGLLPAVMFGRKTRNANPTPGQSANVCTKVTKIYLRLPGSQVELRDVLTGGEPHLDSSLVPLNRGRDWRAIDGSATFFRSDTDIVDETCGDNTWIAMNGGNVINPTGILMMKDGIRYRFVEGRPVWMRDRNGNVIKFGPTGTITDSINRQYQITIGSSGGFSYPGVDGNTRTVTVVEGALSTALRADFVAGGVKTEAQLFPSISALLRGATSPFNPTVIKAIRLPNNVEYRFFYNDHGEIARIEMPASGVVEYDYSGSLLGSSDAPQVYRFVTAKRVYSSPGVLTTRQTFAIMPNIISAVEATTTTTVTTFDSGNTVVRNERHVFKGAVANDFTFTGWYQQFDNGRETTVEVLNASGSTVLQRTDNTYQTLDLNGTPITPPTLTATHPTVLDCALTETKVTLSDTNQISRTTFAYDGLANQTDIYEYDIGVSGSGTSGPLLKRTHADFVNSSTYTSGTGPYILDLPSQQWISSDAAGTNKQALTTYEYDNYVPDTKHAALVDRPNIAGLCLKLDDASATCLQASNNSYITRGNVTQVTSYVNIAGSVIVRSANQYDIAGNSVKVIDGRDFVTSHGYADSFGAPDGEARTNTAPSQLGGLSAFAFVTSTTNPLGHVAYKQYNFHSGFTVDDEDTNGVTTSFEFGLGGTGPGGVDPLDRLSKIIRAANNSTAKTATSYLYDDTNRIITTFNDSVVFDDKVLKEEKLYDGLGRFTETRKYETSTAFIATKVEYDALGRKKRNHNPHRTTSDETYGWTDTSYDLLSRATITQSFDRFGVSTGLVDNAYSGPMTLVTDQAGKKRLSLTTPMGVVKVWEIAPADSATSTVSFAGQSLTGYLTEYEYDARGNLTKITQGTQSPRVLAYDGVGQLTDTTYPESGHNVYAYDATGNVISKTDARNVVTTMQYDALNRLTTRSYSDGSPTFTYNYDTATLGVGRLASVSSSVSSYTYSQYDALGRVIAGTQTIDGTGYTIGYQYNRAGSLISQTYPSGRVISTEYDGAGRVAGVRNQSTGNYYAGAIASDSTNRIQYSSLGNVQAIKLGNTLWEHSNFNSRSHTVQIALGTSITDSSKLKLDYTYGVLVSGTLDTTKNNGNVQSQTITMPGLTLAQSYTYDDLNRLKSATEVNASNPSWKQTYNYDRFGNRTFNTVSGNTTLPEINPQNEAITNPSISSANNQISTAGYAYDAAGNLKCDPEHPCVSAVAYYAYNPENLIKTTGGGSGSGGASYFYDADGRRVKKVVGGAVTTTTVFVYDVSGKLIAEYTDAAPIAGGTSYVTADNLGTPRVITNSTAGIEGRHDYQPFGEEIDSAIGGRASVAGFPGNDALRQKFTNKERDLETGLDFFGARYYASKYGRFSSIDPMAIKKKHLLDPRDFNRYAYVANNPLKYLDAEGLEKIVIVVRTYIPAEWVEYPRGTAPRFKGDFDAKGNRVSSRTEHKIMVETDSNKPGANGIVAEWKGVGETVRLAKGLGSMSGPSTGTADGSTMKASFERINDNSVRVTVSGDEANPLITPSPGITYNLAITVSSEGEAGRAVVNVYGSHDGFPAYEVEIQRPDSGDTSTKIPIHDPRKSGDTPASLAGGGEYTANVHKVEIPPPKKKNE